MVYNNYLQVCCVNIVLVLFCVTSAYSSAADYRIESSAKQSYVIKTFLKHDDVRVQSNDGDVTLSGTVSMASNGLLAREAVAAIPGVNSVTNNLKVVGEMPSDFSDAWIIAQIKSTLLFHKNANFTGTSVSSENGVVTLRGVATSLAQKDLSTEYAKDIGGVKQVVNEMVVSIAATKLGEKAIGDVFGVASESIDDASITAMVKATLICHRSTGNLNTTVQTKYGVVSLFGSYRNVSEKELATNLVSDVYGVKKVVNNMVIEDDKQNTNKWGSTGDHIDGSAPSSTSMSVVPGSSRAKTSNSDAKASDDDVRRRALPVILLVLPKL